MRAIEANGVLTHWREDGPADGPALVFSNSLGTDLRVWDRLLPLLPSGWRFVRYDTRGHGLSARPDGPWRIEDAADDLAALLDALAAERAVVCGLSVGGQIAQSLAARRPDRVRALILMDTAARIGTRELWDDRIAQVRAGGIAAISDGVLARWFSPAFRERAEFGLWRAMLERTDAEGYVRLAEAIRDADLTESTRALRLPCLALVGEHDGSTPPDLVAATAALVPGARCETLAGAGHLPGVEAPEATARRIADFLKELEA